MGLLQDLRSEVTDTLSDAMGESGRVELLPPGGKSYPVDAIVGLISQGVEQFDNGSVTRSRVVDTRRVRVATSLLPSAPNDSWQIKVDGELWVVDRVTGIGGAMVLFHLKTAAMKRIGKRLG